MNLPNKNKKLRKRRRTRKDHLHQKPLRNSRVHRTRSRPQSKVQQKKSAAKVKKEVQVPPRRQTTTPKSRQQSLRRMFPRKAKKVPRLHLLRNKMQQGLPHPLSKSMMPKVKS